MKNILLKNGQVVSGGKVFFADVVVRDGKISEISKNGNFEKGVAEKFEEIDCSNKLILPGLIDCHVHFREPGASYKEDWDTGSRAAISGGVTTVLDMPNNNPPVLKNSDIEAKRKLVGNRSFVNFGFYIGCNGTNTEEINKTELIAGVKVYCAHSTGDMGVSDEYLEQLFERVDRSKILLFHAEDEGCIAEKKSEFLSEKSKIDPSVHSKVRAVECAVKMVERLCEFAKKYSRPIHICHVSTEEEIDIISKYKKFGVTCEVTPHHLTLSEDDYGYLGNFIKINPPVRSRAEVFGLWKSLKAGLVDVIATDHAPHTKEEKEKSYLDAPSGVPGVEMMLPILLNVVNNDGMTIEEVVSLCCERPAEIFKIKNKGKLEVSYDADIVVVDMEKEKKFTNADVISKCGWAPYAGSVFKGWPVMTFVNGVLSFQEGKFVNKPRGREVAFGN